VIFSQFRTRSDKHVLSCFWIFTMLLDHLVQKDY